MTIKIVIQPDGTHVTVPRGSRIIDFATKHSEISKLCGGEGVCGKCKVIIQKGRDTASPITEKEEKHLNQEHINAGYRLACQTKLYSDTVLIIPKESLKGQQRLQTEGLIRKLEAYPAIQKHIIKLEKPSLTDQKADVDRLIHAINEQINLETYPAIDVIETIPETLRKSNWKTIVTIYDNEEIIQVEEHDKPGGVYGVAVDLGSTKIAFYLINLQTGEQVTQSSMMNPQIIHGEDIITRLSYSMNATENRMNIQKNTIDGLNSLTDRICNEQNITPDEIYEMVVVGNTAMHHILLGLNPQHLATSPYTPVISKQVTLRPGDLGLSMYDHGRIQVLPNLAGFIGSDCLSGVYATGVYQSEEPCFFIDIGTNTEIVIGYKERMAACSCASGPAFEGYNIKHGIRARDLAIEKVEIDKETFEPTVETIGGEKPVGICGSGMIDALAEMLRTGIIDEKGRIQKISHPRIRKNSGPIEYVLVWKDETAIDQDITLTQKDIRELQKAKAAITAGASILFQTINLAPENILKAYIAGAFGSYLNQQNAKKIGLLPDIDDSKCIEVGNSAGAGAQMALISVDARKEIQNIASQIKYVELAGEPNFTKVYMKSLNLSKFEIK